MAEGMKRAEAYLVLEPKWSGYWVEDDGSPRLDSFTVARITQKRPSQVKGDALVMRLALRVPAAAFKPLSPSVTIEVPESMLITGDAIIASVEEPGQ